jgi:hypothetical protein
MILASCTLEPEGHVLRRYITGRDGKPVLTHETILDDLHIASPTTVSDFYQYPCSYPGGSHEHSRRTTEDPQLSPAT